MTAILADVIAVVALKFGVPSTQRPAFALAVRRAIDADDVFEAHEHVSDAVKLMGLLAPPAAGAVIWTLVKGSARWARGTAVA